MIWQWICCAMLGLTWLALWLLRHWVLLLLAAFFILPYGPHVLYTYEYVPYSQYGNGRHYTRCDYLGSRGFVITNPAPDCPLIAILDSRTGRR